MRKFNVTGMSCAACSARIERAVSALEGVRSCSVSLLTNSMGVEGDISDEKIIAAVEAAGYGASVASNAGVADRKSADDSMSESDKRGIGGDALRDRETPKLIKRLTASLCFLIPLMYVSMGHVMWGWPLPVAVAQNPMTIGLIQLLLTAAVIVINQKFFVNGTRGLFHGAPNMDTLVSLGAGASFIWSVYILFDMSAQMAAGQLSVAHHSLHGLYFESAAMILTLITVGKMLEAMAKGRTTNALRSLIDLSPKTATVIDGGEEKEVAVESIRKEDLFIIRPGEVIAVDGIITEGSAAIDESALSGESLPVDKSVGDRVSAGTINKSGFIKCEAERVGEDTTLAQIIKIVSDASATKAPIAKAADKVSGVFVPAVITIAIVALVAWLIGGKEIGYALARAISVLVISCPCALGLATPVAIMVGNGVGAKRGILFKTAESLEVVGKAKTVVLDKTGTVTKGEMSVTDLYSVESDESRFLALVCTLETGSEHPLAAAIVNFARERKVAPLTVENFRAVSGKGVEASFQNQVLRGGNREYIKEFCTVPQKYEDIADKLSDQGKTPMFFSLGESFLGVIAVADVIKDDSAQSIEELKNMGVRVVMLTGDNEKTAHAIGALAGVDDVIAGVLPDGKADVVYKLKKDGKVVMVGDGINDAPALAVADMGIAIGAGTDVAIEAADVVLSKSRLSDLVAAIKLSRATLRNIYENLFWAFFYNAIGIPLAAGLFIPIFNWELNPMFGALAMSLSSFCVVTNALRLNFVNLNKPARQKKHKNTGKTEFAAPSSETFAAAETENKVKGDIKMTKTMVIEGMMCPHCSGRVKRCLESLEAVAEAEVNHEKGTAVLTLTGEIDNDTLKKAVEDQGYTVVSIE